MSGTFSRRRFIRDASLAAGSLFLYSSAKSGIHIQKTKSAIVMGAGLAGLAAAKMLRDNGWSVTVLEARGRLGGRVFSHLMDQQEQLVIELGAEWVGESHTRMRELCDAYKLPLLNNQFESHLIYQGSYFANGQWDYSEKWKQTFVKMMEAYPQLSQKDKERIDQTDWWRYLVNNGCEGRDLDLRELLDSTDFGESIRHVSAFAALAEYAESSPKNEMDLKVEGGNSRLVEKMADDVGRDNIKVAHTVIRVIQPRKGKVTVVCANGTEWTADKVICALPTMAVRRINWEPGLEAGYQRAIDELQYARINKNPVLFSERFWKREDFDMITDQTPHYFYHATKNQRSAKGVLISYSIGDKAAVVANQTDDWRKREVEQTLRLPFGSVLNKIEKVANYYWGNDEMSRGAYALYGKGQWFRLMPILKRKHIHTHFAGEHVADWQGFMEGAINSGEEAAAQII
ncbi:MAG: flavin monoamine oxidase family protein [Chitinophagaceae bacterium]